LKAVGVSATPDNAPEYVKDVAHFVTQKKGGDGAFREFVETILTNNGYTILEIIKKETL
jgi:3-deoxy-D-manno-octulosonate 8-phosphate phosphatase (KDO 8-P phosphatase)